MLGYRSHRLMFPFTSLLRRIINAPFNGYFLSHKTLAFRAFSRQKSTE